MPSFDLCGALAVAGALGGTPDGLDWLPLLLSIIGGLMGLVGLIGGTLAKREVSRLEKDDAREVKDRKEADVNLEHRVNALLQAQGNAMKEMLGEVKGDITNTNAAIARLREKQAADQQDVTGKSAGLSVEVARLRDEHTELTRRLGHAEQGLAELRGRLSRQTPRPH